MLDVNILNTNPKYLGDLESVGKRPT